MLEMQLLMVQHRLAHLLAAAMCWVLLPAELLALKAGMVRLGAADSLREAPREGLVKNVSCWAAPGAEQV